MGFKGYHTLCGELEGQRPSKKLNTFALNNLART